MMIDCDLRKEFELVSVRELEEKGFSDGNGRMARWPAKCRNFVWQVSYGIVIILSTKSCGFAMSLIFSGLLLFLVGGTLESVVVPHQRSIW